MLNSLSAVTHYWKNTKMLEITKAIEWDMGHRVPNHKHKCRNPHGHRYRLEMTVAGEVSVEKGTSQEGMVHDFGDIKNHLLEKIYSKLDHCFLATE
jgi:6-pyruvoyltetrahydropterin/6-carboxytetrahydropterin synthase